MLGAAAIFGVFYIVSSFVLLRKPALLHRRKTRAFKATHISHRGGAGECTENTMEAFRKTTRLGTDMLELDCHLTKDGEVVVMHDGNMQRGTGKNILVTQCDYADLPTYRNVIDIQFDPGKFFTANSTANLSIPRLSDVFRELPTIPINLDIKVNDDLLIRKVADLIRQYDREQITIWGSFDEEVTKKCRALNPLIPTFFPLKRVLKLIFFYYVGLLPFFHFEDDFLELPLLSISSAPDFITSLTTHEALRNFIIKAATFLLMSPNLIMHLKARGIPVYFWVCNTNEDFERAFGVGATAVFTDYPTQLLTFLDAHPEVERGSITCTKLSEFSQRQRCMQNNNISHASEPKTPLAGWHPDACSKDDITKFKSSSVMANGTS